jgi:nicotinamidase-related amidase
MFTVPVGLQRIFESGAEALDDAVRPGHVVHLAIDWQRLYCDPLSPTNSNNLQRVNKIATTLSQVNDFADETRIVAPVWWVYHDPADFQDAQAGTIKSAIAQFREEGRAICGYVDPEHDLVLRKPFKDAFAGTDLHERLQRNGIDTLLISGLYRHYSRMPGRSQCVGETMKSAVELGYKTFIVEDLTVDQVEHTSQSRMSLSQMTVADGAYSVVSDHVRSVLAKFKP